MRTAQSGRGCGPGGPGKRILWCDYAALARRERQMITSQVFVPHVFCVYHARSFLLPVGWRDPISGVPALVQGKSLSLSPDFTRL